MSKSQTAGWHLDRARYWADMAESAGTDPTAFGNSAEVPKGVRYATFATMHAQLATTIAASTAPASNIGSPPAAEQSTPRHATAAPPADVWATPAASPKSHARRWLWAGLGIVLAVWALFSIASPVIAGMINRG